MSGDLDEQAMALQATVAGSLSLEREIGRGAMGTVYLAREVHLDRPVAIKLLHAERAGDASDRERFLREAHTAARLVHPHIVPIYDVGEHGTLAWFVMGFVDGESLADRVQREGPLPPAEAARILQEIGWALAAAHTAGVLHRDVTLTNILLERSTGRAVLVDFGLAEEMHVKAARLQGTPEYLAPELLHGAQAAPQSDLYALGIVGWALCTGHLPITAATPGEVLVRRLQEAPPAIDEVAPGLPRQLRRAIGAALVADPAARPASMEEWLAGVTASAPAREPALPLVRWVESGSFAKPYYAFTFSLAGMLLVMLQATSTYLYIPFIGYSPTLPAVITVAVLAAVSVHFGLAATALRRAAREGYVLTDLQVALAGRIRARVARGTVRATLLGRVVNDLAWLAAGAAFLAQGVWSSASIYTSIRMSPTLFALWSIVISVTPLLWMTWFIGIGFGWVLPPRDEQPRSLRWRVREAFWNSRLGRAAFRLGTIGIRRSPAAPNTLHRPTEVMLQVGITDLCAALPAPQRRALHELPALAERLQRRVGRLRERIALLEGAAPERSTESAALRDRLVEIRDEAIATLERLRRDLLRLGEQVATTGPLTERLQQLRSLDEQLLGALRSIP